MHGGVFTNLCRQRTKEEHCKIGGLKLQPKSGDRGWQHVQKLLVPTLFKLHLFDQLCHAVRFESASHQSRSEMHHLLSGSNEVFMSDQTKGFIAVAFTKVRRFTVGQ